MVFVIIFMTLLALVVAVGVLVIQVTRNARELEVVERQLDETAYLLETHQLIGHRVGHLHDGWADQP